MGPAAIPIVLSVVSAGAQLFGAKKEGDIGKENARNIELEAAAEARNLEDVHRKNVGAAKARGAASGVRGGVGSQSLFVETLVDKQARDLAELRRSGASRANIARRVGSAKQTAGFGKAFASLAGGFGSLAGSSGGSGGGGGSSAGGFGGSAFV